MLLPQPTNRESAIRTKISKQTKDFKRVENYPILFDKIHFESGQCFNYSSIQVCFQGTLHRGHAQLLEMLPESYLRNVEVNGTVIFYT